MSLDGYIASAVFSGGIDGPTFDHFIEYSVLPECSPFPGPKSVLVFDNAAIHNSDV